MSMPVAVIQNGTRPDQKVVTGTIADIAERVEQAGMTSPAMIIVGTVVTLRDKLNWAGPGLAEHAMDLSSATTPELH